MLVAGQVLAQNWSPSNEPIVYGQVDAVWFSKSEGISITVRSKSLYPPLSQWCTMHARGTPVNSCILPGMVCILVYVLAVKVKPMVMTGVLGSLLLV
jgi:hypothetical protein